jgi:hypothetical protein
VGYSKDERRAKKEGKDRDRDRDNSRQEDV